MLTERRFQGQTTANQLRVYAARVVCAVACDDEPFSCGLGSRRRWTLEEMIFSTVCSTVVMSP